MIIFIYNILYLFIKSKSTTIKCDAPAIKNVTQILSNINSNINIIFVFVQSIAACFIIFLMFRKNCSAYQPYFIIIMQCAHTDTCKLCKFTDLIHEYLLSCLRKLSIYYDAASVSRGFENIFSDYFPQYLLPCMVSSRASFLSISIMTTNFLSLLSGAIRVSLAPSPVTRWIISSGGKSSSWAQMISTYSSSVRAANSPLRYSSAMAVPLMMCSRWSFML